MFPDSRIRGNLVRFHGPRPNSQESGYYLRTLLRVQKPDQDPVLHLAANCDDSKYSLLGALECEIFPMIFLRPARRSELAILQRLVRACLHGDLD